MKWTVPLLILFFFMPIRVTAMTGVVDKVDVCRVGNVIFRTSAGWYVNARYLSGVMVREKDAVSGKLKTFGIQVVTTAKGGKGNYYILWLNKNRMDALHAFCGTGMSW